VRFAEGVGSPRSCGSVWGGLEPRRGPVLPPVERHDDPRWEFSGVVRRQDRHATHVARRTLPARRACVDRGSSPRRRTGCGAGAFTLVSATAWGRLTSAFVLDRVLPPGVVGGGPHHELDHHAASGTADGL